MGITAREEKQPITMTMTKQPPQSKGEGVMKLLERSREGAILPSLTWRALRQPPVPAQVRRERRHRPGCRTMAGMFGRAKKQVGSLYTDPFRCQACIRFVCFQHFHYDSIRFLTILLFDHLHLIHRWGMVKSIGLFALGIYLAR